jgi:hypothetical protein
MYRPGASWLSTRLSESLNFIMSEIMARNRSDYALDVESYKIAQLFHELSLNCGERLVAAQHVARRYGVSAQRVLDLASKVEPEPLWRL